MPRRETHYDPMVDQPKQIEMRGFPVTIGGTYVLLDDIVTALNSWADAYGSQDVRDAAYWLGSGARPLPEPSPAEPPSAVAAAAVPPDPLPVDRVEVYPDDPTSPNPRWIARACDSVGRILRVTNGSFDQEYVISDAQQRWPAATVHLLTEQAQDTAWEEADPGAIRSSSSGRRRPSPHRLFPTGVS